MTATHEFVVPRSTPMMCCDAEENEREAANDAAAERDTAERRTADATRDIDMTEED
jgi:hypothetical protein